MFAAELYATDGAEVIERTPEFGSSAQRAEVHSAVAADARRRAREIDDVIAPTHN